MERKVFINHTNHPSDRWGDEQRAAAEEYGEIIDLPFPMIPSEEGSIQVKKRALEMAARISEMEPAAVLCQGEFSYTFVLVDALLKQGIRVLTACSDRVVREWVDEEGQQHRDAVFQFQQFREYMKA